jgi:hypothetical protein
MKLRKIIPTSLLFILVTGGVLLLIPAQPAAASAHEANPVNRKSQTNCTPFETPTQIHGGGNDGKWYCKPKSAPQAGGGGAAARNSRTCGGSDSKYNAYTPSIDIGCRGQGNPIADALFGIIRFLSAGVGLVIVGSIIVGGIQYTGSRGDPQSTAMAINRIRSSLFALLIFIFAYAILNYIIPAGFLK